MIDRAPQKSMPPISLCNQKLLFDLFYQEIKNRSVSPRGGAALVSVQLTQFWQHSPDGFSPLPSDRRMDGDAEKVNRHAGNRSRRRAALCCQTVELNSSSIVEISRTTHLIGSRSV
jgi:hypothetical protein